MPEQRHRIDLPAECDVINIDFVAALTDGTGRPREGVKVRFKIEGDGTLVYGTVVKQSDETTDQQGHATASWWEYPVYRPRRPLQAEIVATADGPGQLQVERLTTRKSSDQTIS